MGLKSMKLKSNKGRPLLDTCPEKEMQGLEEMLFLSSFRLGVPMSEEQEEYVGAKMTAAAKTLGYLEVSSPELMFEALVNLACGDNNYPSKLLTDFGAELEKLLGKEKLRKGFSRQ